MMNNVLDPEELLPFCARCFYVGAIAEDEDIRNYCHMCGSGGTCILVKRKFIELVRESLNAKIRQAITHGRYLEAKESIPAKVEKVSGKSDLLDKSLSKLGDIGSYIKKLKRK